MTAGEPLHGIDRSEHARALLYANGVHIATRLVGESNPPDFLIHNGTRFDRAGSSARLDVDGVEFIGYDYTKAD